MSSHPVHRRDEGGDRDVPVRLFDRRSAPSSARVDRQLVADDLDAQGEERTRCPPETAGSVALSDQSNSSALIRPSAPGYLSSSGTSFTCYWQAVSIAPATLKTYAEAVRTLASFLRERGMPIDVPAIA